MTVLVAGGAGYIGSHVVKLLVQNQIRVVVLDDLSNGFRQSLGSTPIVVGDISDSELVKKICRAYDVEEAIHFAALKSVGQSMEEPHRYYRVNVGGTVNFVEALHESGVRRIVFSSSASVYGTPSSIPVNEEARIQPESVYAATKAVIEEYLKFCAGVGLNSVSLRYFNAAGASSDCTIGEDWSTTHNLIPRIMKSLLKGEEPLQVYGTDYATVDGTCVRDYVHVEDLAKAHLLALIFLRDFRGSVSLNVGTGSGHSVLEVINAVEQVSGRTVPRVNSSRRLGDPEAVYADSSLAQKVLNWTPNLGLSEIVKSSYDWYLANPNGYEKSSTS